MINTTKINKTSYRVLTMLMLLFKKDMDSIELMNEIQQLSNQAFSKSIIGKYINTCKAYGCEIIKKNNKYHLQKLPIVLPLTETDLSTLKKFIRFAKKLKSEKTEKEFGNLCELINKQIPQNITIGSLVNTRLDNEVAKLEKLCVDNLKLKITYKDWSEEVKTITCSPIEVKSDSIVSLIAYTATEVLNIPYENIIEISQLPNKASSLVMSTNAIYRLRGRLAKRYILRENEQIINMETNSITILNKNEAMDTLIKRLIRYDIYCEIISPKNYREEFARMLEATLANYGITEIEKKY